MKHGESRDEIEPEVAAILFGERLDLARAYHGSLATDGVERGLIGPREVPRLWDRHLVNCALAAEAIPIGASVIDVGSGAGLPGIPLAIARPDLRVVLLEPLLRRSSYLSEFVELMKLDVEVVRGRAEDSSVVAGLGGADVVTSRAVAPLAKLARWSLPLVRVGGVMLALKGESADAEIVRDRDVVQKLGGVRLDVLRCGVELVSAPTIVVRAEKAARGRSLRSGSASPRSSRPPRLS